MRQTLTSHTRVTLSVTVACDMMSQLTAAMWQACTPGMMQSARAKRNMLGHQVGGGVSSLLGPSRHVITLAAT